MFGASLLGRSAGFYVNPNMSAEALLGYGLVFLTVRTAKGRDRRLDSGGFGRCWSIGDLQPRRNSGQLAVDHGCSLNAGSAQADAARRRWWGSYFGLGFRVCFLCFDQRGAFNDAQVRIDSLLNTGGAGDYEQDRGIVASEALDVIREDPVFGAGVNASYEMLGLGGA